MEMTKVIPQLVDTFDFELEHPENPWVTTNVWFVKQSNFRCRVRVRHTG